MGHCCGTLLWDTCSSPDTPRTKVVLQGRRALKLHYKVASSQLPAPQIAPRTKVVLPSHQFSSSSSPDTPRTKVVLQSRQCSPAFRALDTISAEGCAGSRQIALSPHFAHSTRTISAEGGTDESHSRPHFARSTRTISTKGCACMGQIALSPAFRTLDTHDLRRGLRVKSPKRALRTRLPQKLTRQSLQNERFARDFLQKSSGNTHRSTHITQPCQAVSRFQPLQTTSAHTPIPM